MNKEYIYIDGKVVVSDEEGNKKQIEYKENLDEILIQENLVETIENEIGNLKEKKKKTEDGIEDEKALQKLSLALYSIFIVILIFGVISSNSILMLVGTSAIPVMVIHFPYDFFGVKANLRKLQVYTAQLDKLSQMYKIEKVKLENMKKVISESKPIEQGFKTVTVDDKKVLEDLRNTLILYDTIGHREKKLLKFYEKGILREKLEKDYWSEDEIDIVEDYLEEKSKTLIKK